MPKTGAERNRLYRNKIKSDPESYASYKEKDKERKRIARKRVLSPAKVAEDRRRSKERMRLHRLRKKMSKSNMKNDIETNKSAFRTPQALGRAVKRVSSHLPSSPRKKRAVISKIAKSSGLSLSTKGSSSKRQ